jgi:hypothetical protein
MRAVSSLCRRVSPCTAGGRCVSRRPRTYSGRAGAARTVGETVGFPRTTTDGRAGGRVRLAGLSRACTHVPGRGPAGSARGGLPGRAWRADNRGGVRDVTLCRACGAGTDRTDAHGRGARPWGTQRLAGKPVARGEPRTRGLRVRCSAIGYCRTVSGCAILSATPHISLSPGTGHRQLIPRHPSKHGANMATARAHAADTFRNNPC